MDNIPTIGDEDFMMGRNEITVSLTMRSPLEIKPLTGGYVAAATQFFVPSHFCNYRL